VEHGGSSVRSRSFSLSAFIRSLSGIICFRIIYPVYRGMDRPLLLTTSPPYEESNLARIAGLLQTAFKTECISPCPILQRNTASALKVHYLGLRLDEKSRGQGPASLSEKISFTPYFGSTLPCIVVKNSSPWRRYCMLLPQRFPLKTGRFSHM